MSPDGRGAGAARVLVGRVTMALAVGLTAVVSSPAPASAGTYALVRSRTITIPASGAADPNPSAILAYGLGTRVTGVTVTLRGLRHDHPDDLDIELVAPNGTAVALMSDACGSTPLSQVQLTFDDAAPAALPDSNACATGSYRPTDQTATAVDNWEVPPTATTLGALNGSNPNGAWRLYIRDDEDDAAVDQRITDGWALSVTTGGTPAMTIPGPLGDEGRGTADPYPYSIVVTGPARATVDVDLVLPGLTHAVPGTLQMLLVGPGGEAAVVMAGACGQTPLNDVNLVFDDSADQKLGVALGTCSSGPRKPTVQDSVASFPAPAPPGPYDTRLSVFQGAPSAGTWQLYVLDLRQDDGGYLAGAPSLQVRTDTKAPATKVTKRPKKITHRTRAKIKFDSTEAGSRFECKVDKRRWRACTSPLKLRGLRLGRHRVLIRAIDPSGNVDPTPLEVSWRVRPPR